METPHTLADDPPQNCQHCGYSGPLDAFDCGGLPDAMVFCPNCLSIIEVGSGAAIDDNDLELRMNEV